MSKLVIETAAYRVELAPDGLLAHLSAPDGTPLASLRTLTAIDTTSAPDETLAVEIVADSDYLPTGERGFAIERRSTVWESAGVAVVCREDELELRSWVRGSGAIADAHLLGFRSLLPGEPLGFMPSGSRFRSLFSPNPGDPAKVVRSAAESAVIGVCGDGTPGRGHWLFTPAPLAFALATAEDGDPHAGDWVGLALDAPLEELRFVELAYVPGDGAFSLRLDYDGHTEVDGELELPALVLTPGLPSAYGALRRRAPERAPRETPAWWHEPIFCGWGAQCFVARDTGRFAGEFATQANYDGFLEQLENENVVPGTVVIDDKWQDAYGTNRPDSEKWPDLAGWIAGRHQRAQRVLLWWKAWDPEGLAPELCIRNPDGVPVAVDPTNPHTRAELREQMQRLLGPGGLDADGLKIDFTARTPSGRALTTHGDGWGIALLHELLRVVYEAAKDAKPNALVITHTPHPSFVDVTDMIRLNDMMRSEAPDDRAGVVAQMRHRAEVVRAACPGLPIDTDDWSVPSLAAWREYVEAKPLLGVPSLYYARGVDATGEELGPQDYAALRRTWAAWRESR